MDGSKCAIIFYVDNNKISHKDLQVVTQVIHSISEYFEELTVSRGDTHDFWGMKVTIKNQTVYIEMKDQIQEAIEQGKNQGGCKPPNPAKTDLFDVDKSSAPLDEKGSDSFHSVM